MFFGANFWGRNEGWPEGFGAWGESETFVISVEIIVITEVEEEEDSGRVWDGFLDLNVYGAFFFCWVEEGEEGFFGGGSDLPKV